MNFSRYYSEQYPFDLVFEFLQLCLPHNPGSLIPCREFAFFSAHKESLRCTRNRGFETADQLRKYIASGRKIVRFEIGAVYAIPMNTLTALGRKQTSTSILYREFILDFDLPDYNDIRNCECPTRTTGIRACNSCWVFIVAAVRIMSYLFTTKFGFNKWAWFFSGGKGIHGWVVDRTASQISQEARRAMCAYLDMWRMRKEISPGVFEFKPIDLEKCLVMRGCFEQVMKPLFEKYFLSPGCPRINNSKQFTSVLELLKYLDERELCEILIRNNEVDVVTMKTITTLIETRARQPQHTYTSLVFYMLFPRIDRNVTPQLGHLLKAPFVLHPSTLAPSYYLPDDAIDSFDVSLVMLYKNPNSNQFTQQMVYYCKKFKEFISKCK